jgi:peroxiredoxin
LNDPETKPTPEPTVKRPPGTDSVEVPVTAGGATAPAAFPPGLAVFVQMLFVGVAALGVYLFVHAAKDGETRRICAPLCSLGPDYAARNRTAPNFELPNLDGSRVKLSDYRGKVVVLNFWTKTCKPCLEEMPSLNEFAKLMVGRDDVVLVTINTDGSAADAQSTLQSVLGSAVNFTTLSDPDSAVVAGKFGTKLYPETWIIDPNGVIRARLDGPRDWLGVAPLVLQFVGTLNEPLSCDVQFNKREPTGSVCDDIPSAG